MNRIEQLIEELCPSGVEFKELGEVVEILDYLRKPISKDKRDKGTYPYYGANGILEYVKDYIFDGTFLLFGEDGSVINKDGSPVLNWATGKIWVNNHAHVLSEIKDIALLRYIYYYLITIDVGSIVRGVPPKINQQSLRAISIPIPPLPIQQEIVTILDTFTALDASLQAELEARRKQYEHYRNQLLNFEGKEVEWKTLGEIGEFIRGNGLQKKDFTESGVGCIHYGQIYTQYGIFVYNTKSFVSKELASKLQIVKKGDLIITLTSENLEDVCRTIVWLGNVEIVTGAHATIFKHNQNSKYLAYYFQTENVHKQKSRYARGAKVIEIKTSDIAKFKIPIPPLPEQERIVSILDKFEALVNEELPAEIDARRKQYEYYREKLLTFEPLTN